MALKLFQFQKKNVIDAFSTKLVQFEKTGDQEVNFFSLINLLIKTPLLEQHVDQVFRDLYIFLLFESGVCLF